jgi:hypothetical protein
MKYFRPALMSLMTLVILSMSADLRAQPGSRVYRYEDCDCAGELPDQIRVGAKLLPIRFDENSAEQALKSFRAVKYSVWVGIYDRVYVVGTLNAAKGTFRLERWYTIVPFTEYLQKMNTGLPEVRKIRRSGLRRSDFKTTADFDPYSPEFNPAAYQRRRHRRQVKRAASNQKPKAV